ncbi:MAG TPA: hypothetical protein VEB68_03485 [Croceibacterium sp.]|nr:hypothetical protein [Croceibacterium sp.]
MRDLLFAALMFLPLVAGLAVAAAIAWFAWPRLFDERRPAPATPRSIFETRRAGLA